MASDAHGPGLPDDWEWDPDFVTPGGEPIEVGRGEYDNKDQHRDTSGTNGPDGRWQREDGEGETAAPNGAKATLPDAPEDGGMPETSGPDEGADTVTVKVSNREAEIEAGATLMAEEILWRANFDPADYAPVNHKTLDTYDGTEEITVTEGSRFLARYKQ